MLLDANLLVYAVDARSPHHPAAATWFREVLNGQERVGLPWQSLGTFVRIMTHPRITSEPLTAAQAAGYVSSWLESDTVWVPPATERSVSIFNTLMTRYHVTGDLVPDAQLAALAIEHGLEVLSADTDFARFREVRWRNPLA